MPTQDELLTTIIAFEQWRNTRTRLNTKTPASLRQQAVALMPHYSISKIITALKLSHAQLKLWSGTISSDKKTVNFVTLPHVDEKPGRVPLELELRFNNGAQLRLSGELSSTIVCSLVQTLVAQS